MLEDKAASSNLLSMGYGYGTSSGFNVFVVLFRSALHLGQSGQSGSSVMIHPVAQFSKPLVSCLGSESLMSTTT